MNRLTAFAIEVLRIAGAEEEHEFDADGFTTHHWLWPERAEIIYGGLASLIIIGILVWKGGPFVRKGFKSRTSRIQAELDEAAGARRDAEAEAARIRQSLGNIESERERLLAEADEQAAALLADGRARLEAEVAELEAKAEADIAAGGNRVGDELRAEIARLSSSAADRVVERSLDDATQQRLVDDFISKVGATTPEATSS